MPSIFNGMHLRNPTHATWTARFNVKNGRSLEEVASLPSLDTVKAGVAQSRLSNEQPSVLQEESQVPSPREEAEQPAGNVAGLPKESQCTSES